MPPITPIPPGGMDKAPSLVSSTAQHRTHRHSSQRPPAWGRLLRSYLNRNSATSRFDAIIVSQPASRTGWLTLKSFVNGVENMGLEGAMTSQ
jgi:hypothetical protein